MPDQSIFDDLFDTALEMVLKRDASFKNYKSIKGFHVRRRMVKNKKWIFTFKKRVRVIQILIIEPEFVMESLINDIDIIEVINSHSEDHILEFIPILPGEEKSISFY
ncbi:hypothetical protein D3C76_02670 [compost metagenome]